MNICLIRHADAVPLGEGGMEEDANRPLTEKGLTQCKTLAAAFHRHEIALGKIAVSPLLRAQQTAEEIVKHLHEPKPTIEVCQALAPDGKVRKITRFLRTLESETVAVIGHMPDLARFAGWLLGDKRMGLAFAKSGAAWIECETGPNKAEGVLCWLVTPLWYHK